MRFLPRAATIAVRTLTVLGAIGVVVLPVIIYSSIKALAWKEYLLSEGHKREATYATSLDEAEALLDEYADANTVRERQRQRLAEQKLFGDHGMGTEALVVNDDIYFLSGSCTDETEDACVLGVFNVATATETILIENIKERITFGKFSGFTFSGINTATRTLSFAEKGGDGGIAFISMHTYAIATDRWTEGASATSNYCADDDTACLAAYQEGNTSYDELAAGYYTCKQFVITKSYNVQPATTETSFKNFASSNDYAIVCLQ